MSLAGAPADRPAQVPAAKPVVSQVGNLTLTASKPADPDLDVSEAWIAELSDVGGQIPRPIT